MSDNDEPLELLPLDDEDDQSPGYRPLLDIPCVQACIRNDTQSPFPCLILDTSFLIAWNNLRFFEVFPRDEHTGPSLFSFISGTIKEVVKNDILTSVKSSKSGYAWSGRIEVPRKSISTLFANLLIGPIFDSENPDNVEPIGYRAVIDDLSEIYRTFVHSTFSSLLEASLLKDQDTGQHVARINKYSLALAEILMHEPDFDEVNREFINNIGFVAAMHDVGKIGTPDDILNKEGPLSDWEWGVMKEHTKNGAYILSTYSSDMAKKIALFHHEKWNGTGYPYGMNQTLIPLPARIVTLTDVYPSFVS
jgi:HD-GYP domain-containing protein (c-di-GMP phosphodiesterase class II)